jgi:DNA-binding XRE family transcriptional regulator
VLIPEFVSFRHQSAQPDMQTIRQPEQGAELRVAGSPNQCVELLGVQACIPVQGVLIKVWVFGKHQLNRLTECCMVRGARRDFAFRRHEQQFYSSTSKKDRADMDYHGRRQSSASQFGEFSISEHTQQRATLRRLGEAFQQIRAEQGWNVDELAAATGVLAKRIHALEAGTLDPDLDMLLALAEVLGLRPSDFIRRAESLSSGAEHD